MKNSSPEIKVGILANPRTKWGALLCVGSLATLTGCQVEPGNTQNPVVPQKVCSFLDATPYSIDLDRDLDGLVNSFDRFPDSHDPYDIDSDGTCNATDASPYTGNTFDLNNGSCKYGIDSDRDGIPDQCDLYYNPQTQDSDGDNIPDNQDSYPNNSDRDGDGYRDGVDKFPNDTLRA